MAGKPGVRSQDDKRRWRSIRIMYLALFLGSVGFSICISSIWPYLQVVDPETSSNFLGWVVASYSLGQMIASPLFGMWSNCRGRAREPMVFSQVLCVLGYIMFAYASFFPVPRRYYLLISRFLIGFSAGNGAVIRAYISEATYVSERTGAVANLSIFQALGFLLGPVIQIAFVPLGHPGPLELSFIALNMYTAPAYASALLETVTILLMFTCFHESRVNGSDEPLSTSTISIKERETNIRIKPSRLAIACSIVLFFFIIFNFAVMETIITPMTQDMYAWTKSMATLYNGIILAVAAILGSIVFLLVNFLSRRFDERKLLMVSFLFLLAGFIIYLPWGNELPPRPEKVDIKLTANGNETTLSNVTQSGANVTTHAYRTLNATEKHEPVGCSWSQTWCDYIPVIYFAQYIVGTISITIGYAAAVVLSTAIFSKVLGYTPQGTMMGILTASGCLARTLGPILISYLYSNFGPRMAFGVIAAFVVLAMCTLGVGYKSLIPFHLWRKEKERTINLINVKT